MGCFDMAEIEKVIEDLEQHICYKQNICLDGFCKENECPVQNAIQTVRELQSQIPKWHLVADGDLPNDRRTVLVVAYWHETYQVMGGSYYGDGLWWCVPFNNCGEHMQKLKPKAWCELPKFEGVE